MNALRVAATAHAGADPIATARQAADAIRAETGSAPTLTVAFVSPALASDPWTLVATLRDALGGGHLIGCTTDAPLADNREFEEEPAIALWALSLPGAAPIVRHVTVDPDGSRPSIGAWQESIAHVTAATPVVCLADPFTFPTDVLLADHHALGLPTVTGGLASGGARPGDHALFIDDTVHFEGAVLAALPGVTATAVVSQGCRPIGPDMVITAGGGNTIETLAGTPAYPKIMGILEELADDRRVRTGMVLGGIVIDENIPEYRRGDFLVRALHGRDPETGAVVIGEQVRVGQTFHLQLRDADTADEDLRSALEELHVSPPGTVRGALVFTCNGRGRRLFGAPDHDARLIGETLDVPVAGMFCNGEIGPVGGRSHLHGYSVSMLIFNDATSSL